ncbi:LPS translocon maturation chaperone LptM [Marinobacter sp. SBS5]|uniref:LPS translocon maturation chaperone LptM n=1 Tax=Marinobacter sp. SBS5 TaxID=3401754 RepID=UPI003AAF8B48
MQTMRARRLGYVALCLLAMLVMSGCGQKGPLYREAPVAVDVPAAVSEVPETDTGALGDEQTAH